MKKYLVRLSPIALALALPACEQPAMQCVVARRTFIAQYELVEGSGTCAKLVGEEIGLATFLQPGADGSSADYDRRVISVQSETLGGLAKRGEKYDVADAEHAPYALGHYTNEPDDGNLCHAGTSDEPLAVAEQSIPEVKTEDDEGNPVTYPASHVRQTWSDLSVYVTAGAPGTQLVGRMTYEDLLERCKATYDVVALAPAVQCEGVDAEGNRTGKPDDKLCDPSGDPVAGRMGSGINPDFKTRCDPELLYCVLAEPPLAKP